jgi:hypothetical protein
VAPSRKILLLCAALCAVGLGRLADFDLVARPRWLHGVAIDQRYRELLSALPATGQIGYLTDEPLPDPLSSERYTQAQFALAPRELWVGDAGVDLWLADLADPRSLDRICQERSLEPTAVFSAGHLALLRRKGR